MKVEVRRVRELLLHQLDGVFSLEKRKLDLQRAIREREDQISVFMKMLGRQLKASEEERQRLRFHSPAGVLAAAWRRRLTLLALLPQPGAERAAGRGRGHEESLRGGGRLGGGPRRRGGQTAGSLHRPGSRRRPQPGFRLKKKKTTKKTEAPPSPSPFYHQAALEREELVQKAELLDARIHKMEQENRALHNTGRLISSSNAAFRESLRPADGSGESPETTRPRMHLPRQLDSRRWVCAPPPSVFWSLRSGAARSRDPRRADEDAGGDVALQEETDPGITAGDTGQPWSLRAPGHSH